MNATSLLPRIVRFFGTTDSPGSVCPHCGATGRYIHTFEVDDGRRLGAMSGCVQLFPVSPIAAAEHRILEKERQSEKKGWRLNRWDLAALDAIEAFYAGTMSEGDALRVVERERRAASAWRSRKYGR